jgi:hypothetical protein
MGLHQPKKLLNIKGNNYKIKTQPTEWENIFANSSLTIRLIFRYTKGTNNPINKQVNELVLRGSTKE